MPPSRKRRRVAEPTTVADLLPQVLTRLGGDGRLQENRVFEVYARLASVVLPAASEAERLREGTLWVRVGSSALAHEVAMRKAELLDLIKTNLGPDGPTVTDIRTRVGRIEGDGDAG